MKKIKTFFRRYVSVPAAILYAIGIISAGLYCAFMISKDFSEFFNENVSSTLRFILAKATSVFPISLAEALIFTSPVILFLVLRAIFKYMDTHEHGFGRAIVSAISAFSLLFSVFTLNFAAGYRAPSLDEKLGFETGEVSVSDLRITALTVTARLNSLANDVKFAADGTVSEMTHSEIVNEAYVSYEKLSKEYPFIKNFKAPVKRLAISPIMTYTHISGVYTFFTGEANINTNYPSFVNVYTIAHEMAHQRGIARENEANFIAYLVCINSNNKYLNYCGYLNMFDYLITALYSAGDKDGIGEIYSYLDSRVYNELVLYEEFFEKYSESAASEIAGSVNDTFLQSQGTPGTKSYGMVVDLAVAYHKATD